VSNKILVSQHIFYRLPGIIIIVNTKLSVFIEKKENTMKHMLQGYMKTDRIIGYTKV